MPYVLEAFPRAQLLIAGNGYMYGFIKLLIKRLNIEDNVKLLGFVPDKELPELYNLSDVFVLPSLYSESFGITLLEAMASGKPIVASKVGGIPEVVENGWTGILVRRGNEKDLADAIIKILTDHSLAETLASNARKLVEEKYSWSIVTEEIESVYKEVL
jgi:glycosyltransferase involved in cell wall biosynthesis